MKPAERLSFSAISQRPRLELPGGARLAVWIIVNIEEWDIDATMPRTVLTPPAGGSPIPDIPNWAWHEYGNRVGFWRMLKLFDQFDVPGVLAINGSAIETYKPIAQAALDRNWEFMGHGYTQKNMQKVDDEELDIRKTTEAIQSFTGKKPRGWLGPGLTETWNTPDILQEQGYDYLCDWVLDDQPAILKTRKGEITNIPYTQECNDVAMMLIQHHKASEYRDRALDQFEQLHEDARDGARVMALVLHPYIMGAPHRLKYFKQVLEKIRHQEGVVFWTGEQILDWHQAERARLAKSGA
ncbi:MAG: polysaccharide deacetylase [Hyphomicrobiales bacterium]|nr:polysaccharide deacetylase [Hyphomicrobiales bacterium]